ncbi:MAG: 4-hydroxythreonine-4-phosphate dehydrogenase PdxA, partial [Bacteroidales bacterium]|nr:4-hydroxythreonine-4-phosphate dehydrogenase PdxA [Bacteroidales bacterium]
AIEKANAEGIDTFGPYSADGFFGAGKYMHFDAVLAMYHDQGLIPFKSLDMSGVNFTAGLPIVRTSPDHGTAYDVAGKNEASALSFNHALFMAIDVINNRAMTAEINKDPLVITEQPRPERPAGRFFVPPKEEFHD